MSIFHRMRLEITLCLLTVPQNALEMFVHIFICSPTVRHNGLVLSCRVEYFQYTQNETSSR